MLKAGWAQKRHLKYFIAELFEAMTVESGRKLPYVQFKVNEKTKTP